MTYYYIEVTKKMNRFRVKKSGSDEIIKSFPKHEEALDFIEKIQGGGKTE